MTELRKFGLLFGAVGAVLCAYFLWRESPLWVWPAAGGALFALCGLIAPAVLRPVHWAWMKLAHVLGWVNTRILLGLFYYLVMTPIGLILRLLGKDLLGERIDRETDSYWIRREETPFDSERYRRLF